VLASSCKNHRVSRWQRAGWDELVLLSGIAGVAVGAWLLISLAGLATGQTHQETEEQILLALRNPQNLSETAGPWWLREVGRDVSGLGSAVVVITVSMLVCGLLAMRRQYAQVVLIAVTVAGGYLLSHTLKTLFDRPRPEVVPHLSLVSSASFPSGHAMVSSLTYLTLGALLARSARRRSEKVYLLLGAGVIAFAIGVSRVFLGVHYPTDVIGGWCAGTAWALVCWLTAQAISARRAGRAGGGARSPERSP